MISTVVSALYRRRVPIFSGAVLLILGGTFASYVLPSEELRALSALLPLLGTILMCVAVLSIWATAKRRTVVPSSRTVQSPVHGRWLGMNSPATKVPSHGVRAYGQSYAIDLVYEPSGVDRPQFGDGPGMRAPQDFAAFGQPVLAMISGTVVAASATQRDHRSRSNWPAVIYMMIEGAVREIGGPRFVVGNHVTIRSDDGSTFALVAHLRQGSLLVRPGDTVLAGQQIAECGNSGNSSEPHVHAQLMDRASLWQAEGLPMEFEQLKITSTERPVSDQTRDTLPANGEHMHAEPLPLTTTRA